jgi:hypothetical protein
VIQHVKGGQIACAGVLGRAATCIAARCSDAHRVGDSCRLLSVGGFVRAGRHARAGSRAPARSGKGGSSGPAVRCCAGDGSNADPVSRCARARPVLGSRRAEARRSGEARGGNSSEQGGER